MLGALPDLAAVIFYNRSPLSAYSMTMQSVDVLSSMKLSLYEIILGCLCEKKKTTPYRNDEKAKTTSQFLKGTLSSSKKEGRLYHFRCYVRVYLLD